MAHWREVDDRPSCGSSSGAGRLGRPPAGRFMRLTYRHESEAERVGLVGTGVVCCGDVGRWCLCAAAAAAASVIRPYQTCSGNMARRKPVMPSMCVQRTHPFPSRHAVYGVGPAARVVRLCLSLEPEPGRRHPGKRQVCGSGTVAREHMSGKAPAPGVRGPGVNLLRLWFCPSPCWPGLDDVDDHEDGGRVCVCVGISFAPTGSACSGARVGAVATLRSAGARVVGQRQHKALARGDVSWRGGRGPLVRPLSSGPRGWFVPCAWDDVARLDRRVGCVHAVPGLRERERERAVGDVGRLVWSRKADEIAVGILFCPGVGLGWADWTGRLAGSCVTPFDSSESRGGVWKFRDPQGLARAPRELGGGGGCHYPPTGGGGNRTSCEDGLGGQEGRVSPPDYRVLTLLLLLLPSQIQHPSRQDAQPGPEAPPRLRCRDTAGDISQLVTMLFLVDQYGWRCARDIIKRTASRCRSGGRLAHRLAVIGGRRVPDGLDG